MLGKHIASLFQSQNTCWHVHYIYNSSFLSSSFTNKVLVNDELPGGQMIDQWEPISFNSVQTPHEVYAREMFFYLCSSRFIAHIHIINVLMKGTGI